MVLLQPRKLSSLPRQKCSTGCPQLDHLLGGGLPCGSLTEVTGEAAASKTQLSLQLLLTVQLPEQFGGLDGSAVYVYTEGEPAMRRLHQMAKWLHLKYPAEALAGLPDPAANIFVEKGVSSGAELMTRLQRLRGLLEQQRRRAATARAVSAAAGGGQGSAVGPGPRPVRLLIVDSVAHVFRDMGDSVGVGELAGRTEQLFKISALLRRYADEFNLAVLLVNQVMDSMADGGRAGSGAAAGPLLAGPAAARGRAAAAKNTGHTGGLRLMSLGREVVPALGLAWANCINTRLFLSRCAAADGASPALFYGAPSPQAQQAAAAGDSGAATPALRKLQVVFSPHLAQQDCYYIVEATGVRGLHPAELDQHDAAAAAAWEQAEAAQRQAQQAQLQQQAWDQGQQAQQPQAWGQGQQQPQAWGQGQQQPQAWDQGQQAQQPQAWGQGQQAQQPQAWGQAPQHQQQAQHPWEQRQHPSQQPWDQQTGQQAQEPQAWGQQQGQQAWQPQAGEQYGRQQQRVQHAGQENWAHQQRSLPPQHQQHQQQHWQQQQRSDGRAAHMGLPPQQGPPHQPPYAGAGHSCGWQPPGSSTWQQGRRPLQAPPQQQRQGW